MGSSRLLTRAVTAAALTLTLFGGVASAAQAGTRADLTTAQRCLVERGDIRVAKAKVWRAKHAERDRRRKVQYARANLLVQKRQAANWCSRAASEAAAQTKAEARAGAIDATASSPATAEAPASVRTPTLLALDDMGSQVSVLQSQIPGATTDELAQINAALDALDVAPLDAALSDLALQLQTHGTDAAAVAALVDALLGDLPAGTVVPADAPLGQLTAAFDDVLASLSAYDVTGSAGQLTALSAQLDQATALLGADSADLTTALSALASLSGGTAPTDPAAYAALLGSLLGGGTALPFALPTDLAGVDDLTSLLGAMQTLTGTTMPTVSDLMGSALDLILGLGGGLPLPIGGGLFG